MKLKNISIFCPITLPYKSGAGQNAFNLALSFKDKGYKVRIISFSQGGDLKKENIQGIDIVRVPINTSNVFTKILSYLTIVPYFTKYLLKSNLSIVFGPLQGYIVLILLGKIFNKRVVFRSTMFGKDDIKTLILKFGVKLSTFRKYFLKNMGGYISQSPAMTNSIKEIFGDKIPILESAQGVNTNMYYPISEGLKNDLKNELNLPKNKLLIVSVGYLIERKGYRQIFEALNKIQNKIDFHYVIIGNYNPDKSHYMYYLKDEMQKIYDYGNELLGDRVNFLGESNNVDKYLKAADLFILNSSMEGMPNVLLEAMASGLPSIVKSMKGVDNYITFNKINSIVVKTTDELAEAIYNISADDEFSIELGKNATEFISSTFSLDKVSSDILKKFH